MLKKYLLPLDRKVFKDYSEPLNLGQKIKSYLRHPLSHFILLNVALLIVNLLAQLEIIPISLTPAISSVIIYAIISIGFCLLLGYSGLASLGTAGFAGIGAYSAYFVMQKWMHTLIEKNPELSFLTQYTFIIAIIVAIVVAVAIGLLVGFISLRIEGMYLAILTLGLAQILFKVFNNIVSGLTKINENMIGFFGYINADGVMKMDDNLKFIVISVIFTILLWLTSNLINSPTGRAMLAMKNSTSAAQAMGISLIKYRLLAFVISTIYAAIGGVLYMIQITAVTPEVGFLSLSFSLNILGAVIVGGSKSLLGTTFGALIVFGLQSIFLINVPFFQKNPQYMGIFTGILLIVVVMFYPGGLTQLFYQIKLKIQSLIKDWKVKKYGSY